MTSKLTALFLLLAAAAFIIYQQQYSSPSEYESWKRTFAVTYESLYQDVYREKIFLQNLAKIKTHNAKQDRTYEMGLNQFSALTQAEFTSRFLREIELKEVHHNVEITDVKSGDIDWVAEGYVTPVKSLGQCGGVWAFNPVQACQGLYKKSTGNLQVLSVQQVVDCSKKYGNQGCNGGFLDASWKYIKENGISLQKQYPSTYKPQTCKHMDGSFKIGGYKNLADCTELANALTSLPISVAVDASNWSTYKSGIFNNCKASLNHAVVLVGMTDSYWKVKNVWGASWGEAGFMRLARGNTCGICNVASYPTK